VDQDQPNYDAHGNFGLLTFMANLWYEVPLSEYLTPYVGAGVALVDADVGYDDFQAFDPIFDDTQAAFAFQLGAGLKWRAWENVSLYIGYRLRGIDGPKFDSKVTQTPNTSDYDINRMWSHNIIAGVSFGF